MSAIDWLERRGQKFTDDEAREASDFEEILNNFAVSSGDLHSLFLKEKSLSVAKRLVLVEKVTLDGAAVMLLEESDPRIRDVIQARLQEERLRASGGIIS